MCETGLPGELSRGETKGRRIHQGVKVILEGNKGTKKGHKNTLPDATQRGGLIKIGASLHYSKMPHIW